MVYLYKEPRFVGLCFFTLYVREEGEVDRVVEVSYITFIITLHCGV